MRFKSQLLRVGHYPTCYHCERYAATPSEKMGAPYHLMWRAHVKQKWGWHERQQDDRASQAAVARHANDSRLLGASQGCPRSSRLALGRCQPGAEDGDTCARGVFQVDCRSRAAPCSRPLLVRRRGGRRNAARSATNAPPRVFRPRLCVCVHHLALTGVRGTACSQCLRSAMS